MANVSATITLDTRAARLRLWGASIFMHLIIAPLYAVGIISEQSLDRQINRMVNWAFRAVAVNIK